MISAIRSRLGRTQSSARAAPWSRRERGEPRLEPARRGHDDPARADHPVTAWLPLRDRAAGGPEEGERPRRSPSRGCRCCRSSRGHRHAARRWSPQRPGGTPAPGERRGRSHVPCGGGPIEIRVAWALILPRGTSSSSGRPPFPSDEAARPSAADFARSSAKFGKRSPGDFAMQRSRRSETHDRRFRGFRATGETRGSVLCL